MPRAGLLEVGLPHTNQSAYRCAVSCEDAIFATQEVVAKYLRGGSHVYMCLYDLQKAFDSVEYPILLERLFHAGINGRMWRLLKNWYVGGSCQVKLDGRLSDGFLIERGVKQGSVLSPALFLLVMDPLLRQLQASGVGLSVNNFYAGGFLHVDDIRTLATSDVSLRYQINLVKTFADHNLLKLNGSKCEIVLFSRQPSNTFPACEVDGSVLPAGSVGKCLGYWWKGDLSASRSVEENIKKARRAFFHYGSIGVFQGDIGPLSSKEVIESCVMPVLLYGSENWILTEVLMKRLESFQAELVKRVLKWPSHHSNTAAIAVLDVPTMKCRVLVRKLSFLRRVMASDTESLSGSMVLSLCDDVESICLVRECRELEECFGTEFTSDIINREVCSLKEMKKIIMEANRKIRMERCGEKAPLIAKVAKSPGWAKLWDNALDRGWKAVLGLKMLSRVMSHHGRGEHPCQMCDAATPLQEVSVLDHILARHHQELHINSGLNSLKLLGLLGSIQ